MVDSLNLWHWLRGFRIPLAFVHVCVCVCVHACVCKSLCVCMCVCIHIVYIEFWQICICRERVSTWGLCGLGALTIHYYYCYFYKVVQTSSPIYNPWASPFWSMLTTLCCKVILSWNASKACEAWDILGFMIHPVKSVFKLLQTIEFLGFQFDSHNMFVSDLS